MKKSNVSFVFLLLCLSIALSFSSTLKPLFRAARDADKTGLYIIVLKQSTSDEEFLDLRRRAVLLSNDKRLYCSVKTVEKAFTLKLNVFARDEIRSWDSVERMEEEQMAFGTQDPNLPWHLDRIDQQHVLPRDYQYGPQNKGTGVDVYVLDTGINYDHVEFERRAKYGGYDPVDEYYGENRKGRDCQGHGTHVSSLAGGRTFGTAHQINLFSVRVLDCTNFAPWSVVLDGMDYLAKVRKEKKRPMVVVMSLGGAFQAAANEAIQKLHDMGVVVVVAAGNGKDDACMYSPSSSEYAITVAGSNGTDSLYSITNFGKCVDIFAPGDRILGANYSCINCTMHLSGTSMATPMVAGVVAMYLNEQPLLSPSDVKEKLVNESIKNELDFSQLISKVESDEASLAIELTPNRLLQTKGGCGGLYPYRTHFNVTSPAYPLPYPSSQLCEWTIVAEEDEEITITIEDLDLEKEFDYLLVCDGDNCRYDNIIGRYTGRLFDIINNTDVTLRSSSNHISLLLRTDANVGGRGFLASITKYYKGTLLIVRDSGKYLYPETSHTHDTVSVATVIGVKSHDARDIITDMGNKEYGVSWVELRNEGSGVWFYDFLFHNSSATPSKGYVEINSSRLDALVEFETGNGYIVEQLAARYEGRGLLYAVVFRKRSHLVESHYFAGLDLYDSTVTRAKLKEAGWTMICHHVLYSPTGSKLKISAAFHRDKRRRFGVELSTREPKTVVYQGFGFYQFTTITLALGVQNYYPRYVSPYYLPGETEARLSVIYEERMVGTTEYSWFRWGLNSSEVKHDIARFNDSFSPILLTSYVYSGKLAHMVVWGGRLEG